MVFIRISNDANCNVYLAILKIILFDDFLILSIEPKNTLKLLSGYWVIRTSTV